MSADNRCERYRTCASPYVVRSALWLAGGGILTLLLAAGMELEAQDPPKEVVNSLGMKLVRIPAGTFNMGTGIDEKEHWLKEDRHQVAISKPFYMGVFAVTQKQYEAIMGNNPSAFTAENENHPGGPDHPVEQVSWDDAVEFCKKLSAKDEEKKAGRVYRLPTEAEREYACRAGTQTATHYGNDLSSNEANFNGNKPVGKAPAGPYVDMTTKVGSYKPNAFGLYDMHGNVFEWCSDWYDENYYKNSPKTDPQGPDQPTNEDEQHRVVRGGSWYNPGPVARSAYRHHVSPGSKYYDIGFRVVMTVSGKS